MANLLRTALMKKLARAPYRYSSRQLFDTCPPEVLAHVEEGYRWKAVETELSEMQDEGLVHAQNCQFIRTDRLKATPPERQRKPKKSHPRQLSFGDEEK